MTIGIGHNLSGERLQSYVNRIERIQEEIDASNADKREIYAEAKGDGFNVKTLKKLIQERRQDPADRKEQLELFDLYWGALGGGTTKAKPCAPAPAPAQEVVDPETGEIIEPATGVVAGGAPSAIETIAASSEGGPSGGEPTREEADAEEEQEPEQPATEEEAAATAESDLEITGTTTADTTWTCPACGWAGMASMVTDECPDCGASVLVEPGADDLPDFLDRSGEMPG